MYRPFRHVCESQQVQGLGEEGGEGGYQYGLGDSAQAGPHIPRGSGWGLRFRGQGCHEGLGGEGGFHEGLRGGLSGGF